MIFLTGIKTFACTLSGAAHSINLLQFPTWYEYLQGTRDPASGACTPALGSLSDIWLIVAAVIDILLRLVADFAVVFIIYGGVQYTVSLGSPERTDQARKTIISAVIGLTIAVSASVIIGFIAKKLSSG